MKHVANAFNRLLTPQALLVKKPKPVEWWQMYSKWNSLE